MGNLLQHPPPGGHSIHFRGDCITFTLENRTGLKGAAWLRSNIGYAHIRHTEIIRHAEENVPPLSRDWHDVPMEDEGNGRYTLTLPLLGVGRFEAKAYFIESGADKIRWPEGENSVLKVEPAETCASNTMYTAFVRQFGDACCSGAVSQDEEPLVRQLDEAGYAVIPKSGKFRDLIRQLDFIVGTLRCRIIQLLPIHPTPTTYARMGRYGSPFAVMDLLDVDPALAEFDKQTTPLDQFRELADEVHSRNAHLYLDIPINHTGWASHLQVRHPEWFHRNEDDSFMSPGAWGVLWEDLSKLDYSHHELWQYMAKVFLFWCRNGVDGFRCDAGYKIPFEAWEYIIAKVRMEYPDTVFMLEGLGGYKHVTEHLLSDSGMNWAYSEIFQNYSRDEVERYLPEAIQVSETRGNLIHFAETHDNARLAATSRSFARLRVAFCALTSHNGAFGFANGVEWYAEEQINVHNAHSIRWGAEDNMIDWIRKVNAIMEIHPAYHAGARAELITGGSDNTCAFLRGDSTGKHRLLVLANLNADLEGQVSWRGDFDSFGTDLLTGEPVHHVNRCYALKPGQVLCLTDEPDWMNKILTRLEQSFNGSDVGRAQHIRAEAMEVYDHFNAVDQLNPEAFIADPKGVCEQLAGSQLIVTAFQWPRDIRRTILLPPNHILLIQSPFRFHAELSDETGKTIGHKKSIELADQTSAALFLPQETPVQHQKITLRMVVFEDEKISRNESQILQLSTEKDARVITSCLAGEVYDQDRYAVCTNRHGALAHVRIGWAELRSKYDALLSANLDPAVPVDRHTLFTRCRAWVVYRDYSNELSLHCQKTFSVLDDGTIRWDFSVPVGEGRLIRLAAMLQMHPDTNAVQLEFTRLEAQPDTEHLSDACAVTLIIRPDIEDRCNHEVTKAFAGPEAAWPSNIEPLTDGFRFSPAHDRTLHMTLDGGLFHSEPEWHYMIDHPVDQSRGIDGASDLFSPGYFKIELAGGETAALRAAAGDSPPDHFPASGAPVEGTDYSLSIKDAMAIAMQQFIVKRDDFQTVIAGYPWFLDWGRDTLICLRGIIAAGLLDEAESILLQFAAFEKDGTIPNMIRGNDDNNRETSDAPLWFFVACDELIRAQGKKKLLKADCGGRMLREVLVSLAEGLMKGTRNGIVMDPGSSLIFSPSHFTWMDTNYPAGTPREGYPIEIQALWYYALRMLAEHDASDGWAERAEQVRQSIHRLFVIEVDDYTYLADCLVGSRGTAAEDAEADDALRSNQLMAITLGAVEDPVLCKQVIDACEQLLIPGGLRSLADRPVTFPAPVYHDGTLLNDPASPYWGHYLGDEDTRRKPAYHNGTAWTWPFPSYAEALVKVYGDEARETALALLGSASEVINSGCLRQVPEVIDGDTPHVQRGCGAQAWGVTELYRMLAKLQENIQTQS